MRTTSDLNTRTRHGVYIFFTLSIGLMLVYNMKDLESVKTEVLTSISENNLTWRDLSSSTVNVIYTTTPKNSENYNTTQWNHEWEAWHKEQKRRKQALRHSCGRAFSTKPSSYRYGTLLMKRRRVDHLLVDDKHKTIYCYIPKVGCSNWKRVFMILRGDSNATQVQDISSALAHKFGPRMRLVRKGVKNDIVIQKLQNYTKIIVVREPMERLISAYLNKIHHPKGQPVFQKKVLEYVQKTRQNASMTNLEWSEFFSYVLDPHAEKNEHWINYRTLCSPCIVDYDVIIKFESLQEDSERLLRLIKAPEYLHFPVQDKRVGSPLVPSYAKNLTSEQLSGFCKDFGKDFDIFEYNKTEYCR